MSGALIFIGSFVGLVIIGGVVPRATASRQPALVNHARKRGHGPAGFGQAQREVTLSEADDTYLRGLCDQINRVERNGIFAAGKPGPVRSPHDA